MIRFAAWGLRALIATTVLLALVAGLPWMLWRYIGWPLPNHIPAWAEVQAVLLGPMTTTFLLDVLACLCWIIWAVFTFDVARCAIEVAGGGIDAIRYLEVPAAGPIRALASILVGAILLAVLGNRATAASVATSTTTLGTGAQVVATAPAWHHPTRGGEVTVRGAIVARQASAGDSATVNALVRALSVVVRAPRNGVHDSLARIAERNLGDAARWPEIFALNKGKPQPHGHTFTNPHLIYPGEELALPVQTIAPIQPPQNPSPPAASPAPITTSPPSTPAMPVPSTPRAQSAVTDTNSRDPGFSWGSELFVGLGLAAAVSAALVLARRRYRARYRPGSGDRDDLPVAPVVYQLRLAHLRADQGAEDEFAYSGRPSRVPPPLVVGEPGTGASQRVALAPELGVRDGREIALDVATARGLGLVGAGAPAAARALLVAVLTATHHRTEAARPGGVSVVLQADVAAVLGHGAAPTNLPAAVRVVDDLDAALDVLEAEILVRATGRDENSGPHQWSPLVLLARPPQQQQRLQAILDNGAPFGVTGLLLGQWQPGLTCYVREDGTISATGPGLGEALRGTRMFRVGGNDTAELLTLLRQVEDAGTPPVSPPRIVPALPAANQVPREAPIGTGHGDPYHDEPASDTDLEILTPSRPPTPCARPQPVPHQRPATPEPGDAKDEPGTTGQHTPTATARISISVLGAVRVHWHPKKADEETREITGALQPRTKELLVLLALHPHGTTRDTLVSTLWGGRPPARPTNALHTALSRMRRDLATATDGEVTDLASVSNGHYHLDPVMVRVDYWRFEKAVAARRLATTEHQRIDAYREVVNSYGGPLAEGMSKIEWIEPAREATRRDAIDAVAALARALVEQDPQQTLDLLEIARAFDPYNEALYRDIMRLQERFGQLDAIPRTLTLLTTRLAEINEAPSEHAVALATRLRQRHEASPGTPAQRPERDAVARRRPAAS